MEQFKNDQPTPDKPYCNDCDQMVEPCGWGQNYCNNPETATGIVNIESARIILGDQLQ